jgi:hypothetical protein
MKTLIVFVDSLMSDINIASLAAGRYESYSHQSYMWQLSSLTSGNYVGRNKGIKCTLAFNVHGSAHRNNILIYIQEDATLHSLFYLETALHVSGGTSTHHQERM